MSDNDLSISGISAKKSTEIAQSAEVAVFKKALDQQGDVQQKLIEGATGQVLPEGVGTKLNTIA